ncbi:MAG: DNA-3-methyladenine glycosylase [Phycisphaera sp.]|nr:DNA-3-methyladenine glycosylase [Phycisphaera sp.]
MASNNSQRGSRRLGRRFYRRGSVDLAHALLGRTLVRVLDDGTRLAGRIVEAEAYVGEHDKAAHSYGRRRTDRNASMYLDAGHAYVYFTYGMHHCMNIVADVADEPTACLIRALEPTEGVEVMTAHRASKIAADRLRVTDLCSGPAKLTQALAIDRAFDGVDLTTHERLFVEGGASARAGEIVAGPRIGVGYAAEWADEPLRFYVRDNPHVSRPR